MSAARGIAGRLPGVGMLVARIEALEDEVQENRELNRRLAELTDLVAELLVPMAQRDSEKVDALLVRYLDAL